MSQNKQKQEKTSRWGIVIFVLVAIVAVIAAVIWKQKQEKKPSTPETVSQEEAYNPLDYVEMGEYKNTSVSLEVTDEDIQLEIDSLLEEHMIYEQLSGIVQEGDTVYADFDGYVDGQKVDSTCGTDYIAVGSGEWLEEFEAGLLGAQTGTTVVFSVTVPEGTYGDPAVDGKTVEFHVAVHYICGVEIYPEYNDDFIQSISKKYDTVKEYNKHLKKKLQKDNEEQKGEFAWSEVVDSFKVKKYPKNLLEESKQEVLQGYYDMAVLYGCSQEEVFISFGYSDQQEFIDGDLKSLGKSTAKEYLVAQAIAAKEKLQYTPEEYQELLEEEYSYKTGTYATVEEYEKDYKAYIENQALLSVVKKWLTDNTEYIK